MSAISCRFQSASREFTPSLAPNFRACSTRLGLRATFFATYDVVDHPIVVPAGQPPGDYVVMIRVDGTGVAGDHNPTNNWAGTEIPLAVLP